MYAYVKFLEGPRAGNKVKISVTKIKHTFNDVTDFKKNLKYKIQDRDGEYRNGHIIFVESTEDDLDHEIKRSRVKTIPASQLVTASESDGDASLVKYKSVTIDDIKKANHLKRFSSLLHIKTEDLKKHMVNGPKKPAEKPRNEENKETDTNFKSKTGTRSVENKETNFDAIKNVNISLKKIRVKSLELVNNSKVQPAEKPRNEQKKDTDESFKSKTGMRSVANMETDFDAIKNANNTTDEIIALNKISVKSPELINNQNSKVQEYANNECSQRNEISSDNGTNQYDETSKSANDVSERDLNTNSKIKKLLNVHNAETCNSKIEKLNLELEKVKAKCHAYKRDKEKVEKKYSEMKENFKKEKDKSEKYQLLNEKLQNILTENHEEKKIIYNQIDEAEMDIDSRKNFLPVGQRRESDDTIHIGRGERLKSASYNNLLINSKTPSQFVGNSLLVVFSEDILIKSTITGRVSNRRKKKEVKNNDENKKCEVQKLDSVKLQACQVVDKSEEESEKSDKTVVINKISDNKKNEEELKEKEEETETAEPINNQENNPDGLNPPTVAYQSVLLSDDTGEVSPEDLDYSSVGEDLETSADEAEDPLAN